MGRRGRKAAQFAKPSGDTEAREALERRWHPRLVWEPRLAPLVSAAGADREPFHRWFHYRQGFSPQLVREFLASIGALESTQAGRGTPHRRRGTLSYPILDPFCGSGTTIIECGRNGIPSVGVEAEEALAFLVNATVAREFPPLPDMAEIDSWQDAAFQLTVPIHRVALMCAVATLHNADGRPNKGARPFREAWARTVEFFQADLQSPIPVAHAVMVGDARSPAFLADESIGGILTSPPYLSRYDYPRLLRPLEEVYRYGLHDFAAADGQRQLSAGPVRNRQSTQRITPSRGRRDMRSTGFESDNEAAALVPPDAISECVDALGSAGEALLAERVRQYFREMFTVIQEWHRVLVPDATAWLVIGGARLKNVYIPSDLILAEFSESIGFSVEDPRVARRLIDVGRRLGRLNHVSPRETIVVLRRL